jgi:hypothetical protein
MNILTLKKELRGKFFSATFIKKDGSVRKINCRLGVIKALRGGELRYNAEAANNLIVWDLQKKEFRTIPLDKLITLRYNGKEIVGKEALNYALS